MATTPKQTFDPNEYLKQWDLYQQWKYGDPSKEWQEQAAAPPPTGLDSGFISYASGIEGPLGTNAQPNYNTGFNAVGGGQQALYEAVARGDVKVTPENFSALISNANNGISQAEWNHLDPSVQKWAQENPQQFMQQILAHRNPANGDLLSGGAEGGWKTLGADSITVGANGLQYNPQNYMQIHNNPYDSMDFWGPLIIGGVAGLGAMAAEGAAVGGSTAGGMYGSDLVGPAGNISAVEAGGSAGGIAGTGVSTGSTTGDTLATNAARSAVTNTLSGGDWKHGLVAGLEGGLLGIGASALSDALNPSLGSFGANLAAKGAQGGASAALNHGDILKGIATGLGSYAGNAAVNSAGLPSALAAGVRGVVSPVVSSIVNGKTPNVQNLEAGFVGGVANSLAGPQIGPALSGIANATIGTGGTPQSRATTGLTTPTYNQPPAQLPQSVLDLIKKLKG